MHAISSHTDVGAQEKLCPYLWSSVRMFDSSEKPLKIVLVRRLYEKSRVGSEHTYQDQSKQITNVSYGELRMDGNCQI